MSMMGAPPTTGAAMNTPPDQGKPQEDAQGQGLGGETLPIGPNDPAPMVSDASLKGLTVACALLAEYRAEAAGKAPKGKVFASRDFIESMWKSIVAAGQGGKQGAPAPEGAPQQAGSPPAPAPAPPSA